MDRDTISQLSQESSDSREPPVLIAAGEIRRRLSESLHDSQRSSFTRDAEDPSAHVLKVTYSFGLCRGTWIPKNIAFLNWSILLCHVGTMGREGSPCQRSIALWTFSIMASSVSHSEMWG